MFERAVGEQAFIVGCYKNRCSTNIRSDFYALTLYSGKAGLASADGWIWHSAAARALKRKKTETSEGASRISSNLNFFLLLNKRGKD